MEDSITFLGVGGGRVTTANQFRSTGGFVLKLEGSQINVDPGPGALSSLRRFRIDPTKTGIIFCSHDHLDHVNDVNALIYAATLEGVYKRGILISTKGVIKGWLHYKDYLKECHTVKADDELKIDQFKFKITNKTHDDEAVGFKLDTPKISIGYTADTTYSKKVADQYKGCDVLICNVLRPGSDKWKTHMCSDDAAKLASRVRPELLIIQHFGAKMLKVKPLYEARDIQKASGVRTIAATDGMHIELSGVRRRDQSEP